MELVPIIYNSLLIVFSIVSLILLISFFCSKVLSCGTKNKKFEKRRSKVAVVSSSRTSQTVRTVQKEKNRKHYSNAHTRYIANKTYSKERIVSKSNKVRVIPKSAGILPENVKPATRFSIINQMPRERKYNGDLYTKFSKMSVEYTQSM